MSLFARLFGLFEEPPPPGVPPAPAPPPEPAKPAFDPEDPRVPDTSRERLAVIRGLIEDIEARVKDDPLAAPTLIDLKQMREVHLPRLLQSYIDIPAQHRSEIFRRTGRSASYALNDGLDKMVERLRAMSRNLAEGHIDAFADNMRFIDDRYGEGGRSPFD